MFDKLPVFANKLYNNTSDHQDLYDMYSGIISSDKYSNVEEEIFISINKIYQDYVMNGFGSDWSKEYNSLTANLEDISELSYLSEYLDSIKKYARGYKIDKEDIIQVGEDLEFVMCKILEYIDEKVPWTKLKSRSDW